MIIYDIWLNKWPVTRFYVWKPFSPNPLYPCIVFVQQLKIILMDVGTKNVDIWCRIEMVRTILQRLFTLVRTKSKLRSFRTYHCMRVLAILSWAGDIELFVNISKFFFTKSNITLSLCYKMSVELLYRSPLKNQPNYIPKSL